MKRGIFISIEGPDGSGKSTQIKIFKIFSKEKILKWFLPESRAELRSRADSEYHP